MDIVVIGGGMAGARLAHQLGRPARSGGGPGRSGGGPVRLTVLGEEPHLPYNRVLLAEVLAGRYRPELIALPGAGAVRRARAVRLDRDERLVRCDDGSVLRYDRLVLATGSNPVLPPLRGLFGEGDLALPAGVHAFRTMDDCLALSAAAGPGVRAVVVGGGLLGVSAAQALAARGAQVVVAQQGEHLMERHLDAPAAALLRSHLEAQGVEVHTECRVRGVLTEPDPGPAGRAVRSVELADGYCLGADLVVLACGVRPRVGLARAAGLDVAKGIVVDDQLRTSDPAVFAIGDCAQHAGTVYGLAGAARDQADVLAGVLLREAGAETEAGGEAGAWTGAGTDAGTSDRTGAAASAEAAGAAHRPAAGSPGPRYAGTRALTRLTLRPAGGGTEGTGPAALDLAAFGEPVPLPGDDVLRLADATRGAYRKVVVRGDRLVGGVLLGDLAAVGTVARTWEGDEPLPSAPLLHLLTDDGGF
ncbi:NAD(P)/FAD-dependent oxidoreductase [Streptomyces sp. HPF1205]|uniref:NAD(P)/FAD-dependent oxidoreductase n=1 Tax=Streptomyces sp. HPF1205 TaxID=2873262 RepID=UPI001CEDDA7B|nr:FAD-dependent oxidoreductase [Streptomyces sp. HPF1205]